MHTYALMVNVPGRQRAYAAGGALPGAPFSAAAGFAFGLAFHHAGEYMYANRWRRRDFRANQAIEPGVDGTFEQKLVRSRSNKRQDTARPGNIRLAELGLHRLEDCRDAIVVVDLIEIAKAQCAAYTKVELPFDTSPRCAPLAATRVPDGADDPPPVWWAPMLAFRSWRGVSDKRYPSGLPRGLQARGGRSCSPQRPVGRCGSPGVGAA